MGNRHRRRPLSSKRYYPPAATASKTEADLTPATIQKIVTEILGDKSGLSFAKDARDLMIEFCVEFVSLISSEANDIAESETKKTIAVEHIDKALRELGFPEYVQEVLAAAGESKEHFKVEPHGLVREECRGLMCI